MVSPQQKVSFAGIQQYYSVEQGRLILGKEKSSLSDIASKLLRSLETLSSRELLGLQKAFYSKHKNQPLLLRSMAQMVFRFWNSEFLSQVEVTLQKKNQAIINQAEHGNYKPLLQHFSASHIEDEKLDLLSTYLASLPQQQEVMQKLIRGQGDLIFVAMLQKSELMERFPEFLDISNKFFNIEAFKEHYDPLVREAILLYESSKSTLDELEAVACQLNDRRANDKTIPDKTISVLEMLLHAKIALKGKSVVDINWYAALQQGKDFTVGGYHFHVTPKGVEPVDTDPVQRRLARLQLVDALTQKRDWQRVGKLFTLALALPEGELTTGEEVLLKKIAASQRDEVALRATYILLKKEVKVSTTKERIVAYEKIMHKALTLESFEVKLLLKSVGEAKIVKSVESAKIQNKVKTPATQEKLKAKELQYDESLKPYIEDFTTTTTKSVESLPQVQQAKSDFLTIANRVVQKQKQQVQQLKNPYAFLKQVAPQDFASALLDIQSRYQKEYQKAYVELYAKLPPTAPHIHTLMIYHAQGRLTEFKLEACEEALIQLLTIQQELQKCSRIATATTPEQIGQQITVERCYDPKQHPYLQVIEVFLNIYARPEQVRVIEQMSSRDTNAIVQLLMGSGKSFLLLPLLSLIRADGKNIASIMVPDALIMNFENGLRETLGGSYGSFFYMLPEVATNPSEELLEDIYDHLIAIQGSRGVLLASPDRKHALLNSLAMVLDDPKASNEQLQMVLKVLHLLAATESVMGDEVDTLLKTSLKYIITKGDSGRFDVAQATFITDLMTNLMGKCPNLSLPIESIYREEHLPALIDLAVEQLPKEYDKQLARHLFTIHKRADEVGQDCDAVEAYLTMLPSDQRSFLLGIRTALQLVIPTTLTSHCNEEFGVTDLQETFVAVPFSGPNAPTKTQYSSPIEQLVRSIVALKTQGVPVAAAKKYKISDDNRKAVVKDAKKFKSFLCNYLFPQLTVHEERVSSGAQRLVSSVKNFSGFSGTFWNLSTFPYFDKEIPDVEQEVDALLKIGQKKDIVIEKSGEGELLKKINDTHALALIDAAGWLKGYNLHAFAQEILSSRPELTGVIIHNAEGVQVELRRDGKEYSEFSKSEQRFTIYSKQYTTGTDTLQADHARAIMTVDKKMILRDGEQAIFRMRKILQDQTCTILYDAEFEIALHHAIEAKEEITYPTFIRFLLVNQEMARVNENYPAVHQRMQDALQNRISQFLLEEGAKAIPDYDKIREVFKAARWLFIDSEQKIENWTFPVERPREQQVSRDVQYYRQRAQAAMSIIGYSQEEVEALLNTCYRLEDLHPLLEGQKDPIAARVGQQEQVRHQAAVHTQDFTPFIIEGPRKSLKNIEESILQNIQHQNTQEKLPKVLYEKYEALLTHARYLDKELLKGGDTISESIDQIELLLEGVNALNYQKQLYEEAVQCLKGRVTLTGIASDLPEYQRYLYSLDNLQQSLITVETVEDSIAQFREATLQLEHAIPKLNSSLEQRFQRLQDEVNFLNLNPPKNICLQKAPVATNATEIDQFTQFETYVLTERIKSKELIQKQLELDKQRLKAVPKVSQLKGYLQAERERLQKLEKGLQEQKSIEELSTLTTTALDKNFEELVANIQQVDALKRAYKDDQSILQLLIAIEATQSYTTLSTEFLREIKRRTSVEQLEAIIQNPAFGTFGITYGITQEAQEHLSIVRGRRELQLLVEKFPKKGVPDGLMLRYSAFNTKLSAAQTLQEVDQCRVNYAQLKQDVDWANGAIKTLASLKQEIADTSLPWMTTVLNNAFKVVAGGMRQSQLTKPEQRKIEKAMGQLTATTQLAKKLQLALTANQALLTEQPKVRAISYSKELAASDQQLREQFSTLSTLCEEVQNQHNFDRLAAFRIYAEEKVQLFDRVRAELENQQSRQAQVEKRVSATIENAIHKAVPLLKYNSGLQSRLQEIAALNATNQCTAFEEVYEEVKSVSKTQLQDLKSDFIGEVSALQNRLQKLQPLFPEQASQMATILQALQTTSSAGKTVLEVEKLREDLSEIEKKIAISENQKHIYETLVDSISLHLSHNEISSYEAYTSLLSLYDALSPALRRNQALHVLSQRFTHLLARNGQLQEALKLNQFLELSHEQSIVEEFAECSVVRVRESCRAVFDSFLFQESTELDTLSASFYQTYFSEGAHLLEELERSGVAHYAESTYKRFVQRTAVVQAELYAETLGPIAQSIQEMDYSASPDETLIQMYTWLKGAVDFMEVCNRSYIGQSKESAQAMYLAYQGIEKAFDKISVRVETLQKRRSVAKSVIKATCFGVAGVTAIGSGFAPALGLYFIRMAAQNAANPVIDSVTNQLPKNLQPFAKQFMQIGAGFATETVLSRYQNLILQGVTDLTGFNTDVQDSINKMSQVAENVGQPVMNRGQLQQVASKKIYTQQMSGAEGATSLYTKRWAAAPAMTIPTQAEWKMQHVNQVAESLQKMKQASQVKQAHQQMVAQMVSQTVVGEAKSLFQMIFNW